VKTFQTGEAVLFQRESGAPWELGEYLCRVGHDMLGWHRVKANAGSRDQYIVPARRIKHSPAPRAEGVLMSGTNSK